MGTRSAYVVCAFAPPPTWVIQERPAPKGVGTHTPIPSFHASPSCCAASHTRRHSINQEISDATDGRSHCTAHRRHLDPDRSTAPELHRCHLSHSGRPCRSQQHPSFHPMTRSFLHAISRLASASPSVTLRGPAQSDP